MSEFESDMRRRPSPQMIVETVDDHDHALGLMTRDRLLSTAHNFRVAHLLLFNSRGELLLQQLASSRERHPLAWGASVACYLFAGEDYDDAIRRRAMQELGCRLDELRFVGRTAMRDQDSKKFIGIFTAQQDGPFTIDNEHIAGVEFVSLEQLRRDVAARARLFTPTFQHILKATGVIA